MLLLVVLLEAESLIPIWGILPLLAVLQDHLIVVVVYVAVVVEVQEAPALHQDSL